MRNFGRKGGKLDEQFQGPYIICQDLGKGRYRVQDLNGVLLKSSINADRLKLWLEPNPKMKVRFCIKYCN